MSGNRDILQTVPTLIVSTGARAWHVHPSTYADEKGHSTIEFWIVQARWAHPLWHSYAIAMIHLRDVEGVRPATKQSPDKTHEFMIYALHPDAPVDTGRLHHLTPANVVEQGRFENDEAARAWLKQMVLEVIEGMISPDSDFRSAWRLKMADPACALHYRPRVTLHIPGDEEDDGVRH